jgi:hypothetical protein
MPNTRVTRTNDTNPNYEQHLPELAITQRDNDPEP